MKFEYIKPATLKEASAILSQNGERAKVLNGGTDLLVRIRDNSIRPEYVVDVKGLPDMDVIRYREGEGLFLGGSVTMNEIVSNPDILRHYKILAQGAHEVGSFQLRNRATLAGNVCNASPSGDTLPALYVLEAGVKVYSSGKYRILPIREFIQGVRETALKSGEIVTGILLPELKGKKGGAYCKISRRKDVDLATVSAAALNINGSWRVCFGAVAPTPVRGDKTEGELNRLGSITEGSLSAALDAAVYETSPISDVRASREYREDMIRVALKRAVLMAYEEFRQ
jgi:carbon-monoxide dehydrogenase medium subunit